MNVTLELETVLNQAEENARLFLECVRLKLENAVLREQRDHEAWAHAGCLTIAEGNADEIVVPPDAWSLAMHTVWAGRMACKEVQREVAELRDLIARAEVKP